MYLSSVFLSICILFKLDITSGIFLDWKWNFVLVLAHLEPELELFEVDDIGDDGDDDLSYHDPPKSFSNWTMLTMYDGFS